MEKKYSIIALEKIAYVTSLYHHVTSHVTIKITGNTKNILSSIGKTKGQVTRETFTMTSLVHGDVILETDIQIFKLFFHGGV